MPALGWLAVLLWRKHSEALARNPRLRRQREVAQRVRDGLKQLRVHADARQSDEFFALLFHLLQEQLGERLDLPASAITEAVVEEHLRPQGVNPDALAALQELFLACNQARYAPQGSSQELASFVPQVESALRQLQKINVDEHAD